MRRDRFLCQLMLAFTLLSLMGCGPASSSNLSPVAEGDDLRQALEQTEKDLAERRANELEQMQKLGVKASEPPTP